MLSLLFTVPYSILALEMQQINVSDVNVRAVRVIAISDDCENTLYVSHHGELCVYTFASNSYTNTGLFTKEKRIIGTFSPDSSVFGFLTLDPAQKAVFCDSKTGGKILEHDTLAPYTSISLTNKFAVVAGAKGVIEVVSLHQRSNEPKLTLRSRSGRVGSIHVLDSPLSIAWGTESAVEIVQPEGMEPGEVRAANFHDKQPVVGVVRLSHDGKLIAVCGKFDNKCVIADVGTLKSLSSTKLPNPAACVRFSDDNARIIIGTYGSQIMAGDTGRIYCYSIAKHTLSDVGVKIGAIVTDVAWISNGNTGVAVGQSGLVKFECVPSK